MYELMKDGSLLASGVLWTLAYVEMIRRSLRGRGYAMPAIALALNLTWEVVYTAVGFANWPNVQAPINAVWLILDLVILWTVWRFGMPPELPSNLRWKALYLGSLIAGSLALQLAFLAQFGIRSGATYAAFLQNLAMSLMFVTAIWFRSPLIQTARIAVYRLTGSLFATIAFGVLRGVWFALVVGFICLIVDGVCVRLLTRTPARS